MQLSPLSEQNKKDMETVLLLPFSYVIIVWVFYTIVIFAANKHNTDRLLLFSLLFSTPFYLLPSSQYLFILFTIFFSSPNIKSISTVGDLWETIRSGGSLHPI